MSEKRMAGDLCAYGEELSRCLLATDWDCLDAIGEALLTAKKNGNSIWLFGNGGSAATASHVTNDLVKGCRVRDEVGFKAICLNDSSTLLTCLANGIDKLVFSRQQHTTKGEIRPSVFPFV